MEREALPARIRRLRRVILRFMIAALPLLGSVSACGRKPAPPPIVAILMLGDIRQPVLDGVKEGLARYGYVSARDVVYVVRNANGKEKALAELAGELLAVGPDVICPLGNPEAEACMQPARARGIPVVFMAVSNPAEHRLAKGTFDPLPGSTGVKTGYSIRMPKRLQLITMFFPHIKTVTVLYEPAGAASQRAKRTCVEAGPSLGLQVRPRALRNSEDVQRFAESLAEGEHEIILATPSPLLDRYRKQLIAPAAARARIPTFGLDRQDCIDGSTIAYGPGTQSIGVQAARLVRKVLQGSRADSMPIELPENIELSINLKVANQANLRFAPTILQLADFIIR